MSAFLTTFLPALVIVGSAFAVGYFTGRETGREQGRVDTYRRLAQMRRSVRR